MSVISASNTLSTAFVVTADTTGNLVFTTGVSNTVALTIDSTQNVTTTKQFASASMPTGTVLQAVSATNTSSFSTSSGSFVDTGFSASITPKFSTSKILILFNSMNMAQTGNMAPVVTIYRNSTALDATGFSQVYGPSGGVTTGTASASYLDSPATTSSTAYKIYFRNQNNNGTVTLNSSSGMMSIVLLEIAG